MTKQHEKLYYTGHASKRKTENRYVVQHDIVNGKIMTKQQNLSTE